MSVTVDFASPVSSAISLREIAPLLRMSRRICLRFALASSGRSMRSHLSSLVP